MEQRDGTAGARHGRGARGREDDPLASQTGTQAIDRAAELLSLVVQGREPASFSQLAAASGLAKSTASRLLMALERHQLVRRDTGGRFWPGELFLRYAWRGTAEADLVAVAQPFLERLGERTGETINLGVVGGSGLTPAGGAGATSGGAAAGAGGGIAGGGPARAGGGGAGGTAGPAVEQIAQVDSRYLIGGTNWVGLAVPLHCSALGKVLLAFGAAVLPDGPLERRTARTITDRNELAAELARVRERGWAITDEELEPGLVAVAAPVFAGTPAAVAAISVSAPAARMAAPRLHAAAEACVSTARALSDALAGPLGAPAPPSARLAREGAA